MHLMRFILCTIIKRHGSSRLQLLLLLTYTLLLLLLFMVTSEAPHQQVTAAARVSRATINESVFIANF